MRRDCLSICNSVCFTCYAIFDRGMQIITHFMFASPFLLARSHYTYCIADTSKYWRRMCSLRSTMINDHREFGQVPLLRLSLHTFLALLFLYQIRDENRSKKYFQNYQISVISVYPISYSLLITITSYKLQVVILRSITSARQSQLFQLEYTSNYYLLQHIVLYEYNLPIELLRLGQD